MKLVIPNMSLSKEEPQVGDVFQNTKGSYYLIVGILNGAAICLVFNLSGEVINAVSYRLHYFKDRKFIGNVPLTLRLEVK